MALGLQPASQPGAIIVRAWETVPAGADTYDVGVNILPPGTYRVGLFVKSNLTGTTTTLAVAPWMDAANTQLGSLAWSVAEPNSSGTAIGTLVLPFAAGARGTYGVLNPHGGGTVTPVFDPKVLIPYGVRLTFTKGTAVLSELFQAEIMFVRV